jgi:hypothetical protein
MHRQPSPKEEKHSETGELRSNKKTELCWEDQAGAQQQRVVNQPVRQGIVKGKAWLLVQQLPVTKRKNATARTKLARLITEMNPMDCSFVGSCELF